VQYAYSEILVENSDFYRAVLRIALAVLSQDVRPRLSGVTCVTLGHNSDAFPFQSAAFHFAYCVQCCLHVNMQSFG